MYDLNEQSLQIRSLSQVGWHIVYLFTCFYLHLFAGYLLFDIVHCLAHRSHNSSYRVLRWLSKVHAIHHSYFNRKLKYNKSYRSANLLSHVPLEFTCQISGSLISWKLMQLFGPSMTLCPTGSDILPVIVFLIKQSICVVRDWGVDDNHVSYTDAVPKDPNTLIVGPEFHALHHVDPNNYFSSWLRVMDWIIGSAASIRNRNITILHSGDGIGPAIYQELILEKVKSIRAPGFGTDWTYKDSSKLTPFLEDTDILIIACSSRETAKSSDTASQHFTATVIDLFNRTRRPRPGPSLLPEVWHVSKTANLFEFTSAAQSPASELAGPSLSPRVQAGFKDETFLYRCIVSSTMETPGETLAWLTAKMVLLCIRRGATYIPANHLDFATKIPVCWLKVGSKAFLPLLTMFSWYGRTVHNTT